MGIQMLFEIAVHWKLSQPNADRKSTRLNSSHLGISYAVFCLKKKKTLCTPHSQSTLLYCNKFVSPDAVFSVYTRAFVIMHNRWLSQLCSLDTGFAMSIPIVCC